jgi:hypothetical protein
MGFNLAFKGLKRICTVLVRRPGPFHGTARTKPLRHVLRKCFPSGCGLPGSSHSPAYKHVRFISMPAALHTSVCCCAIKLKFFMYNAWRWRMLAKLAVTHMIELSRNILLSDVMLVWYQLNNFICFTVVNVSGNQAMPDVPITSTTNTIENFKRYTLLIIWLFWIFYVISKLFSHLETIDKAVKVHSVLKDHAMKSLAGTFLASALDCSWWRD